MMGFHGDFLMVHGDLFMGLGILPTKKLISSGYTLQTDIAMESDPLSLMISLLAAMFVYQKVYSIYYSNSEKRIEFSKVIILLK